MTLARGTSPQGTEFYDTEGIAYVGNGKFVLSEERDRKLNLFTYVANTTLTRAYSVAVAVDDPTAGATPDATSATLAVTVTAAASPASLIVSEVSPWSSGNSPYAADRFEVTSKGMAAVNLTGFKVDD